MRANTPSMSSYHRFCIAFALCSALVLGACGSPGGPSDSKQSKKESDETVEDIPNERLCELLTSAEAAAVLGEEFNSTKTQEFGGCTHENTSAGAYRIFVTLQSVAKTLSNTKAKYIQTTKSFGFKVEERGDVVVSLNEKGKPYQAWFLIGKVPVQLTTTSKATIDQYVGLAAAARN